jgi:hypothetical protein
MLGDIDPNIDYSIVPKIAHNKIEGFYAHKYLKYHINSNISYCLLKINILQID